MNIDQIQDTLKNIFQEKKKRIVFWYDAEQEFEGTLPLIQIDDVSILRIDEHGALELKIKLETEDTHGKYILYAPYAEPAPEDDWLLDIKLYGYTFHADQASILLKELNLEHQSLRPYLKERKAFFRSQARLNRLKKWIQADDREDDLDIKMLAVITKADQPEPFSILMSLLVSFCQEGKTINDEPSELWLQLEKLGLEASFWKIPAQNFGYIRPDSPSITDFLIRVFVTDLSVSLKAELPTALSHFQIQGATYSNNCAVFLAQWRTNTAYFKYYNRVEKSIAQKLKIDELLMLLDFESFLEVMTFESVERRIISTLKNEIGKDLEKDYQATNDTIKRRLDGYWATTILNDDSKVNLYQTAYKALEAAIYLFELRKKYDAGFSYPSAKDMFTAYTSELFLFDQHYRKFHELANRADMAGWDVLKALKETVESCYSGWFMEQLALTWGDFLEKSAKDCLMDNWKIPYVTNQYEFFRTHIKSTLKQSSRNRLFVIISDAFRFEAAEELTRKINGKYRLKAELDHMLSILPGYTALGMAALLPHDTLSFNDSPKADVIVDGKPCGSLDQRVAILSDFDGTAIKADSLLSMSKDSGREFVKPNRVIYIYHDKIDAIGDKAVSESNTFEAVRQTIDELYALVSFIINSLNGTRVIITADHGFIYQEKAPQPIDKSTLEINSENTVKTHKRFIMGKNLGRQHNAISGNTKTTSNTDAEMEFLLPKGTNRYNFVGGARFFHGGAMLQEVVIPVITVSEMKGKHTEKSEIRQVGVSLLGSYKKLVTNRPVYKLIQTDPVSERMKPITLKVSLRDKNDLISNEETVTFDSSSSSMDERRKSVKLTLMAGSYDNKKEYYLVLRNIDDTEYDRIPIIIDIAFANDF
ncbi:MAG: BREX-1 system phosphatase PglZ type A [Deltaproteobacteria bacterium]|nr:BREX-1 system phosphatase PglZ type A [Deltaproteobacteria bacterium]